jgi:hypothetical protein
MPRIENSAATESKPDRCGVCDVDYTVRRCRYGRDTPPRSWGRGSKTGNRRRRRIRHCYQLFAFLAKSGLPLGASRVLSLWPAWRIPFCR